MWRSSRRKQRYVCDKSAHTPKQGFTDFHSSTHHRESVSPTVAASTKRTSSLDLIHTGTLRTTTLSTHWSLNNRTSYSTDHHNLCRFTGKLPRVHFRCIDTSRIKLFLLVRVSEAISKHSRYPPSICYHLSGLQVLSLFTPPCSVVHNLLLMHNHRTSTIIMRAIWLFPCIDVKVCGLDLVNQCG